MIDKNFYLENLSAFDILIEDEDRNQAQVVIFRVYSILQRDKIWLRDVATEEEISEDDEAFLQEIEEELTELDAKYHFQFDEFYQLVQQEVKKMQATSHVNLVEADLEADLADPAELEQATARKDQSDRAPGYSPGGGAIAGPAGADHPLSGGGRSAPGQAHAPPAP